ncbi:hypothetical protein CBM2599_A120501 [Cupriavidus taiwanensis]|uniref:hypothetical protein n=1 Tax=Cupriavidus taiwanensis TaxID=164546 RepID=UPI000E157D88|nr:hypothetical protein [Cupriavidus taiwanensis]SOY79936.1 hypothetical protein CBM2599_A120501 [Cupriavidus taiwanensis]SOY81905.1 hypothetical protein CBM2600_A120523 [Cupriavidus taiwanensis]
MARTKDTKVEDLHDFITRHEDAAAGLGVVVTRVTFPGAESRVFPGRYAGVQVQDGREAEATYSDGSKHE